jgi:hypothetical protein
MNQALTFAFESVNIFPSLLIIITVLYWAAVFLGALDMGFLDFDLEADYETDVQIDIDLDADVDASGGWFQEFLSFFNLGKVPFMVFFSAFSVGFWLIAMNVNHYFGITSMLIAGVFYIPAIIVALFTSKIITWPLVPVFRSLTKEGVSKQDLAGTVCGVTIGFAQGNMGQIIIKKDGHTYTMNARTRNTKVLKKGSQGIVVEYIESGDYYIVEEYAN